MATACGPEPAPGTSAIHAMEDHAPDTMHHADATLPTTRSRRAAPPPNPSFSFPAAPAASSAPSSFSRATGRRPVSAIESTTQTYQLAAERAERPAGRAALPAFSFNPGASLPPDPHAMMLDPPVTPQSPRTMPSGHRPAGHGHRRGGSEFVGGRIREGNSIAVISGSPTKPESGFASPSLQPPRRGHRRGMSSALSSDLSLLPPPQHLFAMKGSSAPNSPTNFDQLPAIPGPEQSPKVPEPEPEPEVDQDVTMQDSEVGDQGGPPKPASKARVGFSDTLEFIPRPLSLVSTDTSSTITARPGHGVSGSISSLVTCASPGRDSPVATRSPTPNATGSRPSTAGAILERTPTIKTEGPNVSPRRRNSIPALLDLAESPSVTPPSSSPTKPPKRWTFFGLDPFASHGTQSKTRRHSASSADSATRVVSGTSSSDQGSESQTEVTDAGSGKHTGKKKNKRRKMVKGWADSILPRKPKDKRSRYTVRPPTPPASAPPPDDDEDDTMEVDPTSGQATPTVTITESPSLPGLTHEADDVSSPMIDLDAALGPFNTPLPHNPEWEAAQRAAGYVGRRRLHSAQGMRGFAGPGMHYHRRAESAPDLPPFDLGASTIHRFGSSSTMADVFEEEEEEESERDHVKRTSSEESDGDATPPAVVAEPTKEPPRSIRRKSSGLSDKDNSSIQSIRAQRSKASLQENAIAEEPTVRFHGGALGGGSDLSPRASPRQPSGNKELPPFELGPPHAPYSASTPISPYSTSFASSPRSPMSADTQRLSTAPSSVHEETSFQSLLMGEPGPEVRLSVDYDIPSLTSSNSTMTRDSTFPAHARLSQPALREPRPLSVSSAAFGRRRSSLVSLGRLISSSHGERSKLSMEVTMDNEAADRKPRSKTKRFGRLVQFWKPKDAASS
ncbi:hypothetical protein ACRE_011800 [Hapsidospora chrysogenum ATCC 11550]|uniref:Uncharacterized protein n=1 Tax=Hapsidospora chrysogenum (strain ATCC 11550 / CBS 779.69 / DSM 880 / IAM 14645 / JCM 23072 / IMI 49137) TaxID=857340 RepID=A0A086TEW5_HAPC1|nr:hypothetical protein ACRE_011800 [Hapsidospora chrysogenum ATCC 11550]